jgi:hypothetical protein
MDVVSTHSPEVQEAEPWSQGDRSAGAVPDAALELAGAIGHAAVTPDAVILLCCIRLCRIRLPGSCRVRSGCLLPGVLL